jgi:hypothetical protein
MKKFNYIRILPIFFILIYSIQTNAQFKVAGATETLLYSSTTPRATGNDILEDGWSDVFKVSVWDVSSRLGYQKNSGTVGTVALQNSNTWDPDVCLALDAGGDIHALVVYYDITNSNFILEVYDWSGSAFTLQTGSPIVLANGISNSYDYSINIDSDDDGNFVIVFNEGTNDELFIVTGDHSSFSAVNLNNGGNPVALGRYGKTPDVCIYGDGTNRITYTYINTSGNSVLVDSDDFSTLAGGGTANSNVHSGNPTSNGVYFPRIACPLGGNGSSDDWTVVFQATDATTVWEIWGYAFNSGMMNPTARHYTFYSGYTDLTARQNLWPVVAYNNASTPTITVGWSFDHSGGGYGASWTAFLPIVLICDDDGVPTTSGDYFEIPISLGNSWIGDFLSLSGRFATDDLYITYWESNASTSNDVYHKVKTTISTATDVRLTTIDFEDFSNEAKILLNLYDLTGRKIYTRVVSLEQIKPFLETEMKYLSTNIYILEMISTEKQYTKKMKITNY